MPRSVSEIIESCKVRDDCPDAHTLCRMLAEWLEACEWNHVDVDPALQDTLRDCLHALQKLSN